MGNNLYLFTIGLIALSFFLKSCEDKNKTELARDLVMTPAQVELVKKSNRFSVQFFKHANQKLASDDNGFMSPLGIQTILALTSQGAGSETKTAMLETLGLGAASDADLQSYFGMLLKELPRLDPQVEVGFANSVWHQAGSTVTPQFLDAVTGFHSQIKSLNFQSPAATDQVNAWVKENTKGKIEKIMEQVPSDWMFLLMNAIYFKGEWQDEFDAQKTKQLPFRVDDNKTVTTGFINREDQFLLWKGRSFEGVELPYGQGKYAMVLLKPGEGAGLGQVVDELASLGTLAADLQQVVKQESKRNLWIPKFRFTYEKTLNQDLQDLGMELAFSDMAEFTDILQDKSLKIDEVRHKSFVELDEKGTEAAAVTSVGMVLTSMPLPAADLRFDEPFIFVIQEVKTGLILFLGQINNPQSQHTLVD